MRTCTCLRIWQDGFSCAYLGDPYASSRSTFISLPTRAECPQWLTLRNIRWPSWFFVADNATRQSLPLLPPSQLHVRRGGGWLASMAWCCGRADLTSWAGVLRSHKTACIPQPTDGGYERLTRVPNQGGLISLLLH